MIIRKQKTCPHCEKQFTPTTNAQKYCSPECFQDHRRLYKAEWKRKHYKKDYMGSGMIHGKRQKDFYKEWCVVRNEKIRLLGKYEY